MMKTALAFCLFLVSDVVYSQQPVVIEYALIDNFSWNLFKGKVNKRHLHEMGHNTGAVTVSSLSYTTLQTSPIQSTVNITARFHPEESWTRYPQLKDEKDALKHEEGHLDITEIYARRIRQIVSKTRYKSRNFKDQLRSLFQEMAQKHSDEQRLYDRETNHSINKEAQAKWNARIEKELEDLSAYTVPDIKLTLYE
jgi:DNA repair exonuclease SbcCD ATPase subunit